LSHTVYHNVSPDLRQPIADSLRCIEKTAQYGYNHSMGPHVISHWTSEAKKYNVPCQRSCADPSSVINFILYILHRRRENPAKCHSLAKIRQSKLLLI
jgi:hypothetical protein